jgi:glucosamine--fructose-6-phosphate aminotransferase (isomerizing)
MIEEYIPQEIHAIPQAIRVTVGETWPQARQAASLIHERGARRIFVIGNGTSLYTSLAASYTARLLAKPGEAQVLPMMAGDFRYFTPHLDEKDVIVGMSASGEFRDVLHMFDALRSSCLCIGITQVPGSSITHKASFMMYAGGGQSKVPVMTKTYASTLTALHLLMLAVYNAPEAWKQDLLASADRCQVGLDSAENQLDKIIPQLVKFESAFHFGSGPAYPAALETALKMKEMAILHSEGAESWEWASGPAVIVGEKTLCVTHTTGGVGDASTNQGAEHARGWGSTVLEIGPQAGAGNWHFVSPAAQVESFASLSLVPPAALLAYRLARARGYNPNQPEWKERYHSQGMTHIIG